MATVAGALFDDAEDEAAVVGAAVVEGLVLDSAVGDTAVGPASAEVLGDSVLGVVDRSADDASDEEPSDDSEDAAAGDDMGEDAVPTVTGALSGVDAGTATPAVEAAPHAVRRSATTATVPIAAARNLESDERIFPDGCGIQIPSFISGRTTGTFVRR